MGRNTSVEIGDELASFVDAELKAGRFGSASEMVRAGLRLLQDRETKMAALRAAVREGLESGDPIAFDVDDFITRRKARR